MKIQNKVVRKSRWRIEIKKNLHKKIVKATKWQNQKSEYKQKKPKPPIQKI